MNRSLLLWCEIAIARDAILLMNRNVPISSLLKLRSGAAQNAIMPRLSPPEDSGASAKLDIPAEAAQSRSGMNSRGRVPFRDEEGRLLEDKSDTTGVERRAR